jgi:predicted RNA-binding protein with TRAM domain
LRIPAIGSVRKPISKTSVSGQDYSSMRTNWRRMNGLSATSVDCRMVLIGDDKIIREGAKRNTMKIRKGQDLELEITGIAFGGKGLAKVDGFAVFVAQAIPGDRVLARITRKKKQYAEARVLELL